MDRTMTEVQQSQRKDDMDTEEFILRKRLPRKLPKRKNDIYVNRRTNFNAQLSRCQKLLDTDVNEVYIHGMGSAINRAVNLALKLKENGSGSIEVSTNTSTMELVDDLEPTRDDVDPETQCRANSAVHIKVYRYMVPVQTENALASCNLDPDGRYKAGAT